VATLLFYSENEGFRDFEILSHTNKEFITLHDYPGDGFKGSFNKTSFKYNITILN